MPIRMDDKELEKASPKLGRPAAANSLSGDGQGNLLVGTCCNEIYEISLDGDEAPFCYVQGHYEELWAYASHPSRAEFCTGSDDATLRVWDIERRQMRAMAKIEGPIRCCCYSPDGKWIAVGLGSCGKAPLPPHEKKTEGKWIVLDAELLELKYAPPQVRHERCSDIKFSPDGRFIAVGNADNFIDVYTVPGVFAPEQTEFKRLNPPLKGHSSFVNHLDWSVDSNYLQSNCGAHELLYWRLWTPDPHAPDRRLRPEQVKSTQTMRDVQWSTQTSIYGWALRGIWPEDADGTDVNACCRNNLGKRELLATADDFGKVKLFRYPCIVPRADHRPYGGHSSHVTNIGFSHNDRWLVSTGGDDRAVFPWEVRQEK